ncbi:MAG: DUF721 domain-containing protein [Myxococcales bacterium]|nr:MAG: DUF721 domain-containing protein [Myxococcales bacterium]
MRPTFFAPIGTLLQKLVRPPEHVRLANVDDVTWNEVVGPGVGRRARPVRLKQGVLTVRVATSSWAQQLSMLRDDLKVRLAQRGYAITDVRFSVGPVQAPRRLVGAPIFIPYRRAVPLPPVLERVIGLVPDSSLRLILARAASANLAWQRSIVIEHPIQGNLPGLLPARPVVRGSRP